MGLGSLQNHVRGGHGIVGENYDLQEQKDYYWKSRGWIEDEATDEQRATVFRDAMKELFPQMPDKDVTMVLTRALFKVSKTYTLSRGWLFSSALTARLSSVRISF